MLTSHNVKLIDVAHHALQISSALLKVVKLSLSQDELQQIPKKVSATKQKILDIAEDLYDDHILVRLEKSSGKTRKYEFFQQPFYSFQITRENCAYHEIIHCDFVRLFMDIDHTT
jgi:hypothetical protein